MKTILYIFTVTVFIACKAKNEAHNIYGKWRLTFKSGPMAEARFRENGTHDFYVDGKLFSSGKSSFKNDTLKEFDPICGNDEYYGTYKIYFLGGDSIRFKAIEDTCQPRSYDMNGTILHRLKSN